jgi:predicted house-cleaning NTP pyrophosphatase (Maf/HAM1 superfamily)
MEKLGLGEILKEWKTAACSMLASAAILLGAYKLAIRPVPEKPNSNKYNSNAIERQCANPIEALLGNPEPCYESIAANKAIIVGGMADSSDVVGAIDVIQALQAQVLIKPANYDIARQLLSKPEPCYQNIMPLSTEALINQYGLERNAVKRLEETKK